MKNLILLLTVLLVATGCPKKKGCTDINALNKDFEAEKDDGSCEYSKAVFYASALYYNGVAITGVDISVKGNSLGTLTVPYPNGPGNCTATGTIQYQFKDGNSVDWNSTVHLITGGTIFGSGTASPDSYSDCIKVNVTK